MVLCGCVVVSLSTNALESERHAGGLSAQVFIAVPLRMLTLRNKGRSMGGCYFLKIKKILNFNENRHIPE